MTAPDAPPWVADPGVAWNILLSARPDHPPSPPELAERLALLNTRLGWTGAATRLTAVGSSGIRAALASRTDAAPVAAEVADGELVISGHHSQVDGLGLLAVLTELTGGSVASSARGLGEGRATRGLASTLTRRLVEVAFRPPSRVARTTPSERPDLDSFAGRTIDGTFRTADLVYAGVGGVTAYNSRRGARTRRPAIAIGASRHGGTRLEVADNSALLRLRDLRGLSRDEVRQLIATSAPEPPPGGTATSRGGVARAVGVAVRVLSPRLGSTLLVSHLGRVTADLSALAFYPVTGGGSGISLGAVELHGRTTVTLRARGRTHNADGLEELLEAICDVLGESKD